MRNMGQPAVIKRVICHKKSHRKQKYNVGTFAPSFHLKKMMMTLMIKCQEKKIQQMEIFKTPPLSEIPGTQLFPFFGGKYSKEDGNLMKSFLKM